MGSTWNDDDDDDDYDDDNDDNDDDDRDDELLCLKSPLITLYQLHARSIKVVRRPGISNVFMALVTCAIFVSLILAKVGFVAVR